MRVTLRDIAARLNLSVATVSRSLARREDPFISQATRERVLVAADELGYQANRAARALATGSTRMIGLRVAHFFEYYLQVAVHLQREVERDGWRLLICQGWDDQPWPTDGDVHLEAPLGAPAPRPPVRKPAV
nr:LacI family DNA-binding transcriptional regulator [Planctomycetota bacterium]